MLIPAISIHTCNHLPCFAIHSFFAGAFFVGAVILCRSSIWNGNTVFVVVI